MFVATPTEDPGGRARQRPPCMSDISLGRAADVRCWFSVVCNFLERSGGRRNLLGRQHSTPCHELVGTRWQRHSQSSRATGRYGGVRPRNTSSSRGRGHSTSTKAMVRRIKRERSAASTADVKREKLGLHPQRCQRVVERTKECGGVWRAFTGKPMSGGQNSQMHHVSVD